MTQEIRSVGICRGSKRWDTLSLGDQFLMFWRLILPSCSTVISVWCSEGFYQLHVQQWSVSDVLKACITFVFNDDQFLMILRFVSPLCSTVISPWTDQLISHEGEGDMIFWNVSNCLPSNTGIPDDLRPHRHHSENLKSCMEECLIVFAYTSAYLTVGYFTVVHQDC